MITSFSGKFRFLSNFWPAKVEIDGIEFPTVEHAYQASKTVSYAAFIRQTQTTHEQYCQLTPGQAKRLGHKVALRPDWDKVRMQVMLGLLRQKFAVPELAKMLCDTSGKWLIEGNHWHDNFWGVCGCQRCGTGANMLGMLLMQVRGELQ